MGITDPAEFQKVAKDYCKEMAVEMMLPAYMRIFSRINKRVDTQKEAFTRLTKKRDMISHVLKLTLEDEEIVDMFKMNFSTDDSASKVNPDLSADKRNAGNSAFQKKKDKEALDLYTDAVFAADVVTASFTASGHAPMALAPAWSSSSARRPGSCCPDGGCLRPHST